MDIDMTISIYQYIQVEFTQINKLGPSYQCFRFTTLHCNIRTTTNVGYNDAFMSRFTEKIRVIMHIFTTYG